METTIWALEFADVQLHALHGNRQAKGAMSVVADLVANIEIICAEEFGDDSALNVFEFMALNCEDGANATFGDVIVALRVHLKALRREADYMAREQLTERELLAML